jgi:hypothetical protein
VRLRKLFLVLPLAAAACGSNGEPPDAARPLAADVAGGLAARAEAVAAALDAGACQEALQGARALQTDIAALPIEPALRAEALAGATRLTSGINCPVVTTTAPPPVTVPSVVVEGKGGDGKGGKGHKGKKDDD